MSLNLTDKEWGNVNRALASLGYTVEDRLAELEEDCVGARSFHFEVHPSGIGDTVYLVYNNHRVCITDFDNL